MRNATEWLGAEPIIPVRRDSIVKNALQVGRDFVTRGVKRVVELFRKRWSIERLFGRAKEWLLLDGLRVRGLAHGWWVQFVLGEVPGMGVCLLLW